MGILGIVKKMNHTHKYKRITLKPSRKVVYKCQLINCSHYLFESFVWNKLTICWSCGDEFVLVKKKNNQVKPKCSKCCEVKSGKVDNLLEGII